MRPLTLLPLDPTNATARGACAERSEMGQPVCGSLAVTPQLPGSSGCRVRPPAPPAVGRSRSGSCDCIPVTAAYRGLVIGGRASACRVPDNDIPTAVTDRDPHVMSRRWRLFALGFHGTARWIDTGRRGLERLTSEVSHTRGESAAPGQALRSEIRCAGGRYPEEYRPPVARSPGIQRALHVVVMASASGSGGGGRRPTTRCLRGVLCVRARPSRTESDPGGTALLHHTAPGRAGVRIVDPRICTPPDQAPGPGAPIQP